MTPEQVKLLARFAAAQATRPIIRHSASLVFRSSAGSLLIHVLMGAAMLSPVVQLPVTTEQSSMEFFWLTPFFRMDDGPMGGEPEKPLPPSEPPDALPPAAVVNEIKNSPAVELPAMPLERTATAPLEPVSADADLVTAAPAVLPKKRVAPPTEVVADRISHPPPVVESKETHQEEEASDDRMAYLQAEKERRVRDEAARAAEQERRAAKQQKELEQLAVEKSAVERKRLEQARLEKLATDAAAREQRAREEARRMVELERLAQEKVQQEKREQARSAALASQADAERRARAQVELDRLRIERSRQEKVTKETAERDRKVREEKLSHERLLQEKLSAEKAERERRTSEEARLKAESVRLAREQTERDRVEKEAARKAEQARLGREQNERNRAEAERVRLEQLAAMQAKKQVEEAKKAKPAAPRGIPVPVVNGDIKLAITGGSRISLEVRFRPFPKSRRNRPLTRSESRRESQIVPIMVNKDENTREAVIEQTREGIYTFVVSQEKAGQNSSFVLTLHGNTPRKSVKTLGKKTVGERAILTRVLMPEGILWEDEAAFSGSMEDSEGVTKFNSETGLLWKEYGNDPE